MICLLEDLSIRLANLKLDISDRKTKRFFKDLELGFQGSRDMSQRPHYDARGFRATSLPCCHGYCKGLDVFDLFRALHGPDEQIACAKC